MERWPAAYPVPDDFPHPAICLEVTFQGHGVPDHHRWERLNADRQVTCKRKVQRREKTGQETRLALSNRGPASQLASPPTQRKPEAEQKTEGDSLVFYPNAPCRSISGGGGWGGILLCPSPSVANTPNVLIWCDSQRRVRSGNLLNGRPPRNTRAPQERILGETVEPPPPSCQTELPILD